MTKSAPKALPLATLAKSLSVVGLLGCACMGPARAQGKGNVTVYGRLVEGINYQSRQYLGWDEVNGRAIVGSRWGIDGNVWGTSMFGIQGTEDLGGGMQAYFNLESGLDGSTGAVSGGSGLWTRRALVGLSGRWGSVKLGRSLALPTDVIWRLDSGGQQAMGTATLVKGRNWQTYSNQIDYTTPNLGGFTAQGVYGMGEAAGSTRKNRTGGVSLAYVQANYELRAMYDVANDANGRYSSLFQYSKEATLGGAVTRGKWRLFAGYQRLSAPAVASGPDKARHLWAGATYQVMPALTLIGGAYHVELNRDTGTAKLFMVGANYYLSSRTLLYASVGTVRNGAQTSFAVETGDSVAGQNQSAFYSGISHSF
ncbi:MAG: porin [Polaromonas sp.]